jgi:MarR family transcriptional regulator, 2-MHQ and catechol-resistance regulon repressor
MDTIKLIRELVRTYQAFETRTNAYIRNMNLTPSQFDVIVTLGNQAAMTCKTLGEKTLITKGTMTGVLDRLQDKGLIQRLVNDEDARSQKVALTIEGEAVFNEVFPSMKQYMGEAFQSLSETDYIEIIQALQKLRGVMSK